MSDENRSIRAYGKFKKNSLRFKLVPLESTPTLPIPLLINEKPYLAFLFYTAKRLNKNEKMKIFRPNTKILINLQNAKIASYQNYTVLDEFQNVGWEESIGEFPHDEIGSMTLQEYNQNKEELIKSYDKVFDLLMSNYQDDMLQNGFSKLFYRLCEPCLLPFMKEIGKDFFEWLDRKAV